MEEIVIYGAGGFGKEIAWMIEAINEAGASPRWQIVGFLDDRVEPGTKVYDYPVVGNGDWVRSAGPIHIVCSMGDPRSRAAAVRRVLRANAALRFPQLFFPGTRLSRTTHIGRGVIAFANCILSVDITIGDFAQLNSRVIVGHDAIIEEFCTIGPDAKVLGNARIGKGAELGSGVSVIPFASVGCNTTVGAGAVVRGSLPSDCVAVGIPARPVKRKEPAP